MIRCPFCNQDFSLPAKKEVKVLGEALALSANNELTKLYPHVFRYCKTCGMVDIDIDDSKLQIIKQKLSDFKDIMSQKYDKIDPEKFTCIAECRAYAYELAGDTIGATLSYKACLDIAVALFDKFKEEHLKDVLKSDNEVHNVLTGCSLEEFDDFKIYIDTIKELVINVSGQSFEQLKYLGILIYLDTIVDAQMYLKADKMFALLNDKTTKIPEQLLKAKNQLEDRYIDIRKKEIRKKSN